MLGPSDPAWGMASLSLTLQLGFSAEGRGCLQEEGYPCLVHGSHVTVLNHGHPTGWSSQSMSICEKQRTSLHNKSTRDSEEQKQISLFDDLARHQPRMAGSPCECQEHLQTLMHDPSSLFVNNQEGTVSWAIKVSSVPLSFTFVFFSTRTLHGFICSMPCLFLRHIRPVQASLAIVVFYTKHLVWMGV